MNYVFNVIYRPSFFALFFSVYIPCLQSLPRCLPEQWIIIHGTFATDARWHQKNSEEQKALAKTLKKLKHTNFELHSFTWSGENNHKARLKAADELLIFLKRLPQPYHIIAHSHATTIVCIAAQKMIAYPDFYIEELFSLGAPIYAPWYPDAHKKIKTLYHLFSYGDMVQTVVTLFERTIFEKLPHVHNIQLKINGSCPRHSDLHSPLVLEQLPYLQTLIKKQGPYCLEIEKTKAGTIIPKLIVELSREKDLEIDRNFRNQLISLYGQNKSIKIKNNFQLSKMLSKEYLR